MPLKPTPVQQEPSNRKHIWQRLTLGVCVLFGLAMILNTQSAGDSMWFWYASFLRDGQRLYADLHLALQPLFVLETASFMAVLGKGWLVSKIPAVLHLVAYCLGLLLLVRASKAGLTDGEKAVLLASAFFVSIAFEAYRFDDYHVLADCFEVYSLVVLLMLQRATASRRVLVLAAVLGVLSGLSALTRLNDGAVLFLAMAFGIVAMAPVRRMASLAVFGVTCALTALAVVGLSGDSLRDYATYSIFRAAAIKGGTGNVLEYPLKLPWNTLRFLMDRQRLEFTVYVLGAAGVWTMLVLPCVRTRGRSGLWKAVAGVILVLLPLHHFIFRGFIAGPALIEDLSAVGDLLLYGLGVAVFIRFLLWLAGKMPKWNQREILLLVPLSQMASSSMSSGGLHYGIYGPIGILILLLPISSPVRPKQEWVKPFLLAVAVILIVHCADFKFRHPYQWHSYRNGTMFVDREWYRHPEYGPMVVERPFLQFLQPMCVAIKAGGSDGELLSLPFSYPNYFCSIKPWHGYVQTFFDTSSKETIDGLMGELEKSPPKWIVYQRQLDNLKTHEKIYNQGKPLPQRYLDQMIEAKIASGAWQPVYTSTYGTFPAFGDEWILLRTRP